MDDFWNKKKVLITGGMGFIGSSLAHRLVDEGASVTIIDARLPGYGANQVNLKGIRDDIRLLEDDVRTRSDLESPIEDTDVIYHCAAQLSRTESMKNPVKDTGINCQGLLNILDICGELEDPPRLVFPSSQAVVGKPSSLPIDGETPAEPLDIYGANKRAGELYCQVYERSKGVPTTVARLTNVYGPRAQFSNANYGVIHQFIRAGIEGESLTVFNPGTMTRDFVYVEDVVSGLLSLGAAENVVGERYLIGSGVSTSIKELANNIVEVTGNGEVELVEWPDDWDSIKIGDISSDPSKLESDIDWQPSTNIDEGLKKTIPYYEDRISAYLDEY
jgi:UDP-glucose 4-epimerase